MFVTASLPSAPFYVKFFVAFEGSKGDLIPIINRDFAHSKAIMGEGVNFCPTRFDE
jgi:hypothetical protein